jgi:hypothetical protein
MVGGRVTNPAVAESLHMDCQSLSGAVADPTRRPARAAATGR